MQFLKLSIEESNQLKAILGKMPHEYGQLLDIGLNVLNRLQMIEDVIQPPENNIPS